MEKIPTSQPEEQPASQAPRMQELSEMPSFEEHMASMNQSIAEDIDTNELVVDATPVKPDIEGQRIAGKLAKRYNTKNTPHAPGEDGPYYSVDELLNS